MSTEQKIYEEGSALAKVQGVLIAIGVTVTGLAPAMADIVGESEANTLLKVSELLIPIAARIHGRLQDLGCQYQAATAEVSDLEALFQVEAVTERSRPGAGGYL